MSKIIWKTQEQIDIENNTPKPPTTEELLEQEIASLRTMLESLVGGVE